MDDLESRIAALDGVRNLHIGLETDAEAKLHVGRLLDRGQDGDILPSARRFTKTGETRGMMLVGAPGSGKSHLMDRTLRKISELAPENGDLPRYVACTVPSPATFKSMTLQLLEKSGYPHGNTRKEAWSLWQQFRHRISMLGIAVVWIDEAQDLFCADRKLILRALKSLMQGDDAVAVILSGTDDLSKVIRTDPQVKRRFSAMVLPEMVEAVHGDMFRSIMDDYCARVDLIPPRESDIVGRIFHGARNCFGRAIELLLDAMECAILREVDGLDFDHFAFAYAMAEACGPAQNVFYADEYLLIDPDADPESSQRSRKKSRRRV